MLSVKEYMHVGKCIIRNVVVVLAKSNVFVELFTNADCPDRKILRL